MNGFSIIQVGRGTCLTINCGSGKQLEYHERISAPDNFRQKPTLYRKGACRSVTQVNSRKEEVREVISGIPTLSPLGRVGRMSTVCDRPKRLPLPLRRSDFGVRLGRSLQSRE
ncbi:hypothetical protein [Scytonema sp. PCC 10023]|uniref:hypothetical protein n=1 Tax=Scytonema sp. PCC 10023 TaxID=1680591 RepID=UPI0039C5FF88